MLWGITSYFNPAGYKSRLANYRMFRSRLKVPLLAVELSFSGDFDLRPGDAEILLQISGGDVMWQKERLLNLALAGLPSECDLVAWLDCDIIFGSDDWPERTHQALESFAIVQLYSERCNLLPGAVGDSSSLSAIEMIVPGSAYKFVAGTLQPEDLFLAGSLISGRCTNGLAWASTRRLLSVHSLYDARIIGSGDKSIACAAMGKFEYAEQAGQLNARQRDHYRAWANPFYADVQAHVGYVEGRVFHLWHGDSRDRQYDRRHANLAQFEFDPYLDIALDANRAWRWNSDKPELHAFMRRYFGARQEDGRPSQENGSPSNDRKMAQDGDETL
jgi:hypothetical protein